MHEVVDRHRGREPRCRRPSFGMDARLCPRRHLTRRGRRLAGRGPGQPRVRRTDDRVGLAEPDGGPGRYRPLRPDRTPVDDKVGLALALEAATLAADDPWRRTSIYADSRAESAISTAGIDGWGGIGSISTSAPSTCATRTGGCRRAVAGGARVDRVARLQQNVVGRWTTDHRPPDRRSEPSSRHGPGTRGCSGERGEGSIAVWRPSRRNARNVTLTPWMTPSIRCTRMAKVLPAAEAPHHGCRACTTVPGWGSTGSCCVRSAPGPGHRPLRRTGEGDESFIAGIDEDLLRFVSTAASIQ